MYIRNYETPEDSVHRLYLERTVNCDELEDVKMQMWNIAGGTPKETALRIIRDNGFQLLSYEERRVQKGERPEGNIIKVLDNFEDCDYVYIQDDSYSTCAILKDDKRVGTVTFCNGKLSMFSTREPRIEE